MTFGHWIFGKNTLQKPHPSHYQQNVHWYRIELKQCLCCWPYFFQTASEKPGTILIHQSILIFDEDDIKSGFTIEVSESRWLCPQEFANLRRYLPVYNVYCATFQLYIYYPLLLHPRPLHPRTGKSGRKTTMMRVSLTNHDLICWKRQFFTYGR